MDIEPGRVTESRASVPAMNLTLRIDTSGKGFFIFLAPFITILAMMVSTKHPNLGWFSLSIFLGATLFGYVLIDYMMARRALYVFNEHGMASDAIGRLIPWSAIRFVELLENAIILYVNENDRSWSHKIDLTQFKITSTDREILRLWGSHHVAAVPLSPMDFPDYDNGEYTVQGFLSDFLWPRSMSILALSVLCVMTWKIPFLGVLFAPFGMIFGGLGAFMRKLKTWAVRANAHSLWVNATQSIPWNAVAHVEFENAEKTAIQLRLKKDHIQIGSLELNSPVSLSISKVTLAPDDVLARFRSFLGQINTEVAPTPFAPNTVSMKTRLFYLLATVVLVAWGGYGVFINDLMVPAKRDFMHLHGPAAWVMYGAWLFGASFLVSVIIDHYDRRDNETRYKRFQNKVSGAGWAFFVLSLGIWLTTDFGSEEKKPCPPTVLRDATSPNEKLHAYAYILDCSPSGKKLLHITVLKKGESLNNQWGNTAQIEFPNKLSDLRWKDETLQVVHFFPWKLKRAKKPPVAVYAVPQ